MGYHIIYRSKPRLTRDFLFSEELIMQILTELVFRPVKETLIENIDDICIDTVNIFSYTL